MLDEDIVGGGGGLDPDQRLGFRDLIRSAQMQSEESDSIENSRESDGIRLPGKMRLSIQPCLSLLGHRERERKREDYNLYSV